jgi:beta-galactosidase
VAQKRVRVHPHGLELSGGEVLPLLCGSMHYWRHSPSEWGAGLSAMKSLGFRLLDTYVPWGVHELEPGVYDFGERDPRKDVARFLKLAAERDLKVVLRPGPHINAELTWFGLPERIVWNKECQARTPAGNPVVLPMIPVAFPVPSYASEVFHVETERWFHAVSERLAPLRYPEGPIVVLQVDNEGALYFRDGPYDQDYHPDAVRMFRDLLRAKYKTVHELREAWKDPQLTFLDAFPPKRFDAKTVDDLPRHMDWVEFHEHILTRSMERMAQVIAAAGFDGIPTSHNFPLGEAATPLNPAKMTSIDIVGLDYYHKVSPASHTSIMRRTSELASRCEGLGTPAFGAEVGAGFPPFFAPLDENDSTYTLMCAMAYGLRGYNAYMAVERDRWVGAPIDPHGNRRPFAEKFEKLHAALERSRFHTLRRRAPVRLVVPRSLRRLARATHAFGPLTPALFNVLGAGFRESVLENDFGTGEVATVLGEAYLRAFERALTARGVPFAYAGGETLDVSTRGASWLIVTTAVGVKPELFTNLRELAAKEVRVTIGPKVPPRDGSMRAMPKPHDTAGLEIVGLADVAEADALVAKRIQELSLPTYPVDPLDAYVCVHEDAAGIARVAFVMNPTEKEVTATIGLPGATALEDMLKPRRIGRVAGAFEVKLKARTVRMFAVDG